MENYSNDIPEYRSAIVDECGFFVEWTDKLKEKQIEEHLKQYPEHRIELIRIN